MKDLIKRLRDAWAVLLSDEYIVAVSKRGRKELTVICLSHYFVRETATKLNWWMERETCQKKENGDGGEKEA